MHDNVCNKLVWSKVKQTLALTILLLSHYIQTINTARKIQYQEKYNIFVIQI
jgi:hypothetical protein